MNIKLWCVVSLLLVSNMLRCNMADDHVRIRGRLSSFHPLVRYIGYEDCSDPEYRYRRVLYVHSARITQDHKNELLMAAVRANAWWAVEIALESGADVRHDYGFVLSLACGEMLSKLLEKGLSVNCTDPEGNTALHRAARNGRYQQVSELLEHKADADLRNKAGRLPLDLVEGSDRSARHIRFILQEHMAVFRVDAQTQTESSTELVAEKKPLHCEPLVLPAPQQEHSQRARRPQGWSWRCILASDGFGRDVEVVEAPAAATISAQEPDAAGWQVVVSRSAKLRAKQTR